MMEKGRLRKIWWTVVGLYLAVVYMTLGVARGLWDVLNEFLGGRAIGFIYLVGIVAVLALFVYMVFKKKERSPGRYLLFLLFVSIFFILSKLAIYPVEKFHLLEYGGLSFLVYNALKTELDRYDIRLYILGSLICVGAGVVDEVIQLALPNRVFDYRDIILNAVSSVTAFMVIRFNILDHPQKALPR